MENRIETRGFFYVNPTMTGDTGLVGLKQQDYEKFMAYGMLDQEVLVKLTKANTGSEYPDGAPEYKARAGIYTITMDGTTAKPQIDLSSNDVSRMRERGFRDLDEVLVEVEQLPYKTPHKPDYGDLKIEV
ncbi:MAG: hypothetical protein ACOX69_04265 [Coriobacteriales bacterium]|jgi:hypothetical protein